MKLSLDRAVDAEALREHREYLGVPADLYTHAYYASECGYLRPQPTYEVQVPYHDDNLDFLAYLPQDQGLNNQCSAGAFFGKKDSFEEQKYPSPPAATSSSED